MPGNGQDPLLNEAVWVARCLKGDLTGFEALVRKHDQRLRGLLYAMLSDPFDVEDVYQETLLRAYLNLDGLRLPHKFGAWVTRIAVNLARSWRVSKDSSLLEPLDELDDAVMGQSSPISSETILVHLEEKRRIRQVLDDLPPGEREAVRLIYLDGMSHKEAAEELGATLNAVKVRVHRGRRHLREVLLGLVEPVDSPPMREVEMIEMKIQDVLIHFTEARNDFSVKVTDTEMKRILSRMDQSRRYVVLLKEVDGLRALPIWTGSFEAEAIVMVLNQAKTPRPITFDLMKSLLKLGNLSIERVEINRLHETVFIANMIVRTEAGISEIDCRPSDALNLAVRLGTAIYAASEIMDANSQLPTTDGTYMINPVNPEMVWESLLGGDA